MSKFKGFVQKIKSVKHIELIVAAVAVVVILFIYFASLTTGDTATSKTPTSYGEMIEQRLKSVLSDIDGAGDADVLITWDKYMELNDSSFMSSSDNKDVPTAIGVIVVCEGGDNAKTIVSVKAAVSALLNLTTDNIYVFKKSKIK